MKNYKVSTELLTKGFFGLTSVSGVDVIEAETAKDAYDEMSARLKREQLKLGNEARLIIKDIQEI